MQQQWDCRAGGAALIDNGLGNPTWDLESGRPPNTGCGLLWIAAANIYQQGFGGMCKLVSKNVPHGSGHVVRILTGFLGWSLGLVLTLQSMGSCGFRLDAWVPEVDPSEWGFLWGTLVVSVGAVALVGVIFWHYLKRTLTGRRLFLLVFFAIGGASWWLPVFTLRDGIAVYGAPRCTLADPGVFNLYQGAMWSIVVVAWLCLLAYVVFGPLPRDDDRSVKWMSPQDSATAP